MYRRVKWARLASFNNPNRLVRTVTWAPRSSTQRFYGLWTVPMTAPQEAWSRSHATQSSRDLIVGRLWGYAKEWKEIRQTLRVTEPSYSLQKDLFHKLEETYNTTMKHIPEAKSHKQPVSSWTSSLELLKAATAINTTSIDAVLILEQQGMNMNGYPSDMRDISTKLTTALNQYMLAWLEDVQEWRRLDVSELVLVAGSVLHASNKLKLAAGDVTLLGQRSASAVMQKLKLDDDGNGNFLSEELLQRLSLFCRLLLTRSFRWGNRLQEDSPEVKVCQLFLRHVGTGSQLREDDLVNSILVFSSLLRNEWVQHDYLYRFMTVLGRFLDIGRETDVPVKHQALVLDSLHKLSKELCGAKRRDLGGNQRDTAEEIMAQGIRLTSQMCDEMKTTDTHIPEVLKYSLECLANWRTVVARRELSERFTQNMHFVVEAFLKQLPSLGSKQVLDAVRPLTLMKSKQLGLQHGLGNSDLCLPLRRLVSSVEGSRAASSAQLRDIVGTAKKALTSSQPHRTSHYNAIQSLHYVVSRNKKLSGADLREVAECIEAFQNTRLTRKNQLMAATLLSKILKQEKAKGTAKSETFVYDVLTNVQVNELQIEDLSLLSVTLVNYVGSMGQHREAIDRVITMALDRVRELVLREPDNLQPEDFENMGTMFHHLSLLHIPADTADFSEVCKILFDKQNIHKFSLASMAGILRGLSSAFCGSDTQSPLPVWCTRQIQNFCVTRQDGLKHLSLGRLKTVMFALTTFVRHDDLTPGPCIHWEKEVGMGRHDHYPRLRLETNFESALIAKLYDHSMNNPHLLSDWAALLRCISKVSWRREKRNGNQPDVATLPALIANLCRKWENHLHAFASGDLERILIAMGSPALYTTIKDSRVCSSFLNDAVSRIPVTSEGHLSSPDIVCLICTMCSQFETLDPHALEKSTSSLLRTLCGSQNLRDLSPRLLCHLWGAVAESGAGREPSCVQCLDQLTGQWIVHRNGTHGSIWLSWVHWYASCLKACQEHAVDLPWAQAAVSSPRVVANQLLSQETLENDAILLSPFAIRYPIEKEGVRSRKEWKSTVEKIATRLSQCTEVETFTTFAGLPVDLLCRNDNLAIICEMPSDRTCIPNGDTASKPRLNGIVEALKEAGAEVLTVPVYRGQPLELRKLERILEHEQA
eukprot:gb/GECG01011535.1/.p1 GENE.gb/GECG01011535.1/~~gb/GECG01011535.1/.p1  ORF type:complete len:1155 (+),score=101.58 gb/GECG01011535.1/:1-3465(+)